jgi:hypothetical protein
MDAYYSERGFVYEKLFSNMKAQLYRCAFQTPALTAGAATHNRCEIARDEYMIRTVIPEKTNFAEGRLSCAH